MGDKETFDRFARMVQLKGQPHPPRTLRAIRALQVPHNLMIRVSPAETLMCRVPQSKAPDASHVPIAIPMWGVQEVRSAPPSVPPRGAQGSLSPVQSSHLHMETRLNFLFHMEDGLIVGASAYPGGAGSAAPGVPTGLCYHDQLWV